MRKKILGILAGAMMFAGCLAAVGIQRNYTGFHIENADEITEILRTAMLHRAAGVKITFQTSVPDDEKIDEIAAKLVSNAFYESDEPKGGDYLHYQYGGYELESSMEKHFLKYSYQLHILPVYYSTAGQEEKVDELVEGILADAGTVQAAGEYEKIRWVHDYICAQVSYDTVHKHMPGSGHTQSTAYGALVYHTALCQGYAVLCYRLLKELGVQNRIVAGEAEVSGRKERHAWNIACVDGVYYNLDVTMDDVSETDRYFLKSDAEFFIDHIRDEKYRSKEFYELYPMSEESY